MTEKVNRVRNANVNLIAKKAFVGGDEGVIEEDLKNMPLILGLILLNFKNALIQKNSNQLLIKISKMQKN